MGWANVVRETDPIAAEDIFRDLIKRFPDQIFLRYRLAQFLMQDHGRENEALAVLTDINTLPGPPITELNRRQGWDTQAAYAKLLSARIMTEQLQSMPLGDQRKQQVKNITSCIDDAQKRLSGTSALLRELGRFQLVNNQKRDAINTLTLAVEKMKLEGGAIDNDLVRLEATAYSMGEQNGKAAELIEARMAQDPVAANSADMHYLLAEMLLKDQGLRSS